jgi:hypothetical protein
VKFARLLRDVLELQIQLSGKRGRSATIDSFPAPLQSLVRTLARNEGPRTLQAPEDFLHPTQKVSELRYQLRWS